MDAIFKLWLILACITLLFFSGLLSVRLNSIGDFEQNYGLDSSCNGVLDVENCATSDSYDTIILGDSYAMHLVQFLPHDIFQLTKSACPPVLTVGLSKSCIEFNKLVIDRLDSLRNKHEINLYLSSSFSGVQNNIAAFFEAAKNLELLGYRVVIVGPPPVHNATQSCLYRVFYFSRDERCSFNEKNAWNYTLNKELISAAKTFKITYVDLFGVICDRSVCKTISGDRNIYRDNGHFSNVAFLELPELITVLHDAPSD